MALTESQKQTTTQPWWMTQYSQTLGQAGINQAIDPATGQPRQMAPYTDPLQAPTNPLLKTSQDTTFNWKAPDFATVNEQMSNEAASSQSQKVDPNAVKLGVNYTPGQYETGKFDLQNVQWEDTLKGYSPDVQAYLMQAAGVNIPDYMAEKYSFTPQQVAAMGINGPNRGDIRDVNAPTGIQAYLMSQPDNIIAPELKQFLLSNPNLVSADKLADPRMWDKAAADQYANPYQQGVTDIATRKAKENFYEQLANAGGRAASAGAYGGSRQAVLEGAMRRDYATQASDIQTQGLDAAYKNAQMQFAADRAAQMQSGQFNVQTGLQAALANQRALQETALANQQVGVQGAELGLKAAMANQAAGLTAGQANQQAQMAAQDLYQKLLQQGQTSNQAADIAFGTLGLDASKANQDAFLKAAMANQSTGLEADITGAKLTQSDKQFGAENALTKATTNAQLQQQATMANQQANMAAQQLRTTAGLDALKTRYEGGLKAGISNQQAGIDLTKLGEQSKQFGFQQRQQGEQFGSDLDLRGQTATETARSQRTRDNLVASGQAADIYRNIGLNDQAAADLTLKGNAQQAQQGQFQQEQDQKANDRQFDLYKLQQAFPMLSMTQLSTILANMPNQSTTTTSTQAPSVWNQIIGGLMGAAGIATDIYTGKH